MTAQEMAERLLDKYDRKTALRRAVEYAEMLERLADTRDAMPNDRAMAAIWRQVARILAGEVKT